MVEKIRKDIILKILSNIPVNIKPVEYIMRTLNISKGSTYRRLNGTLPFSYDEIAILARELNFSIDEVICSSVRTKYVFEFEGLLKNDVMGFILNTLTSFYNKISSDEKMKNRNIIVTANHLWFIYTLHFDNLFKFYCYKFLQQYDRYHLKDKMKDIDIPQSVIDIKNKFAALLVSMDNTYRISVLDRHIFFNTIYEIQYYYRRNLIEEKELKAIAGDLKRLLNIIEEEIMENKYNGDKNVYFLAERNVYTNSASIETDENVYSFTFQNDIYPIICYDKELGLTHRNYLDSHKKQSIFISASNEQLQIAFFEKQYEYIRNLVENRDLVV